MRPRQDAWEGMVDSAMFIAGKLLAALLFPPGLFIVLFLVLAALALAGRKRAAAWVGLSAALLLWILSTQAVSGLLVSPLEDRYPPLARTTAGDASLIVVLGGGSVQGSPEYGGRAALVGAGARRAAYGAELHKLLGLPLLYSGGTPLEAPGAESEAAAAGRFWEAIGIRRDGMTLEGESRDTAENALLSAAAIGGRRVILVTSAFHMPRAMLSFRQAGIEAVPAPTDYRRDRGGLALMDFLPSPGALETTTVAIHEYVGLAWYSLRPRGTRPAQR